MCIYENKTACPGETWCNHPENLCYNCNPDGCRYQRDKSELVCEHCHTDQFSGVPVCSIKPGEVCADASEESSCQDKLLIPVPIPDKKFAASSRYPGSQTSPCPYCQENELAYSGIQNGQDVTAAVIKRTPISMRKNPDKPATLHICIELSHDYMLPISHCPYCGRKL